MHCHLCLVHRELHNEDLSSSSPLHLACRWIDHHYWLSPKQVQNRHHIRIFCRRKTLTIKSSCQNTFACNHGILGVLECSLSVQLHSSKTIWCKNAVPAKPSFVQSWHLPLQPLSTRHQFLHFWMYSVWWIVPVKRSLKDAKFTFSVSGFAISLPSGIYKELLRWLQSLFYYHNNHQISNSDFWNIFLWSNICTAGALIVIIV